MKTRVITRIVSALLGLAVAAGVINAGTINIYAAEKSDEQVVKEVFDAKYYAGHNPDVVVAVGDSEAALFDHYFNHGLAEGRNASATFNAKAYRLRNADLDAAYGDDWIKYVRHYVTCGKAEGRDATPLPAASQNDPNAPKEYELLGSYTTKYRTGIPRAVNVGIAAAGINGVVVQPGAEFSYTNTIPARTVENGYQEATIFVNKEKVQGLGGGICQVSSTLYACMKTVGLPATERHPHSLPVDYLPEGWDATISGQSVDLKFVNIYSTPLMIACQADNGRLTVSLYLQK
ncbi:MAG: VanW family protein [Lachnospiraceae bacterium]|nr:VanW family protein [Lachnospiraceae bacterium]